MEWWPLSAEGVLVGKLAVTKLSGLLTDDSMCTNGDLSSSGIGDGCNIHVPINCSGNLSWRLHAQNFSQSG